MDSALDYLIKQGKDYVKEYKDIIKDKLIPKRFQESQKKKAGFLFFKLKKYLNDKKYIKVEELEEYRNKELTRDPIIILNKNNSIIEKLKELIAKYTWYQLSSEELKKDLNDLTKIEKEARSADYLVYKRFNIEDSNDAIEDDYIDEENQEEFFYEVSKLARNVIRDIDSALYSDELKDDLERGDVVEIIDPATDDEDEQYNLMFVLEKQGESYTAFRITNDDEPYITSVLLEKDTNNITSKNACIQMDTRYLVGKNEVINKVGHVSVDALNKISEYAKLFESKSLTKDFVTKPIQKIESIINLTNELKWRK